MHHSSFEIKLLKPADESVWDNYVYSHPHASLYHLAGWKNVIGNAYGHPSCYLMAFKKNFAVQKDSGKEKRNNQVVGILPLIHLKHFLFGNSFIGLPYFDMGGILADNLAAANALLNEAAKISNKCKADTIELRHSHSDVFFDDLSSCSIERHNQGSSTNKLERETLSHKVRMLLDLPESSDILMWSFKSKLRSQINKPIKEGLYAKVGGIEGVDDFYKVFLVNMRDLGSPVHSKSLIVNLFRHFSDAARTIVVYKESRPLAAAIVVGFKDVLENPWASSLREYSRLSPNMLLYWTMLEYACDSGYRFFDFGRSTPGEGTHKFKAQWGAIPFPLHWHYIYLNGHPKQKEDADEKTRFRKAIQYWQKLPVAVTRVVGPMLRKHIGL